jgi:hypothetical protein
MKKCPFLIGLILFSSYAFSATKSDAPNINPNTSQRTVLDQTYNEEAYNVGYYEIGLVNYPPLTASQLEGIELEGDFYEYNPSGFAVWLRNFLPGATFIYIDYLLD